MCVNHFVYRGENTLDDATLDLAEKGGDLDSCQALCLAEDTCIGLEFIDDADTPVCYFLYNETAFLNLQPKSGIHIYEFVRCEGIFCNYLL